MAEVQHFDIVVIGGGSGLTAAYFAARDGKSIALVTDRPESHGRNLREFRVYSN